MNQNENARSGGTSPRKPKKSLLLPTMIALIAVMAAVLILGVSGLIRPGDSASSAPSSGGAISISAGASSAETSSGEYAVSSGERAAAAGGSVSGQTVASVPSASESRTDSSVQQSGSAAPSGTAGSGAAGGANTTQRTETTGSAISQAAPKTQPFSPQEDDSASPSQTAPDGTGGSVSRQEYNKLTQGMSYDDVAAAFGDPGTLVDSAGSTKIYEWNGSSGSSVRVTFKDGALAHKYQFGL